MKFKRYVIFALLVCSLFSCPAALAEEEQSDATIQSFLNELFSKRAQFLVMRKPEAIKPYYLEDYKPSVYALRQEMRRSKYLNRWAEKRKITLLEAKDRIRIIRIKLQGDQAKVSLINSLQLTYSYPNKLLHSESFGLGTRHGLTLKRTDDGWHVMREWYLDPFDVDGKLIPDGSLLLNDEVYSEAKPEAVISKPLKYNRLKAVAYAQKYAGAAWGAGNNNRYNPRYRDYTYIGGDCTNFASQVIGDPEGGGLPMRGGWRYTSGGGTEGWVRTDSLKSFLFNSGYAKLVARGHYEHVIKREAIDKLQVGDLVAYEIGHGNVDHFAVIVGFDANRYPLVNCHTADRYAMPFDLGWDKYTKYLFIHMND
jgi:hypothetical protein